MKIRIKGDTIRLRLSQTEVDEIAQLKPVIETTHFAASELRYCLTTHEKSATQAVFENNQITVYINCDIAKQWASTDQVGIETDSSVTPSVLVEKDFQCLTVREGEDESDLFTNPNTSC